MLLAVGECLGYHQANPRVQLEMSNKFCAVNLALCVLIEVEDMVRMREKQVSLKRDCIVFSLVSKEDTSDALHG